jgi:hypothetical protein
MKCGNGDIFLLQNWFIIPDVLRNRKARDPWPNVDAISGSQYHYGIKV